MSEIQKVLISFFVLLLLIEFNVGGPTSTSVHSIPPQKLSSSLINCSNIPSLEGLIPPPLWTLSSRCNTYPEKYACTPSGYLWEGIEYFTKFEACEFLQLRLISRIQFIGDSYIRHAYEAFVNLLTDDFERGAYDESMNVPNECFGEGQFEEKTCRLLIAHQHYVCNGIDISLKTSSSGWFVLDDPHPDIIIWGFGNHPVDGNYDTRYGIHDVKAVTNHIVVPVCNDPYIRSAMNKRKIHLFSLLGHSRLNFYFNDEEESVVGRFNKGICQSLLDNCNISSIDIYTPTFSLTQGLATEAKNMTWDGAHWSRAVNVLKANYILHAIERF